VYKGRHQTKKRLFLFLEKKTIFWSFCWKKNKALGIKVWMLLPTHAWPLQAQPLALQKLAAFLHEAHFQDKKRDRPVVVIGPKSADARCLVVGFAGNPRSGTVRRHVRSSACRRR
jgi:hypothetical protein